jgi:hypothetical protein
LIRQIDAVWIQGVAATNCGGHKLWRPQIDAAPFCCRDELFPQRCNAAQQDCGNKNPAWIRGVCGLVSSN